MFHVIHTHKSSPRTSHMPHIRFASFGISSVRPLCFLSARKKKLGHKTPMPRIDSASAVWFTRSRQAFGFSLPCLCPPPKKLESNNSPLQPPQISKIHQKPALHPRTLQITLNLPLVNLCEVRHCLQLHKMCVIYHHVSDKRNIQKLALVIHGKLHLTANRKAFCRQFLFQRLLIHRFQITGL